MDVILKPRSEDIIIGFTQIKPKDVSEVRLAQQKRETPDTKIVRSQNVSDSILGMKHHR